MKEEALKATIFKILYNIAPDMDPEELEMEDNIREALGIDSFDFLQFVIGLDEELGIKTPEEDYGKIGTLKALISYIRSMEEKRTG